MLENKKVNKLNEDELEDVSGGVDSVERGKQYFIVNSKCGGSAPLRSSPWWKEATNRAIIPQSERIYSEGISNPGTKSDGVTNCLYIYCCYGSQAGWVDADFLDLDT